MPTNPVPTGSSTIGISSYATVTYAEHVGQTYAGSLTVGSVKRKHLKVGGHHSETYFSSSGVGV